MRLRSAPAWMGFDPRRWRPSPNARPLTTNVEALLAENEALRRQVRALSLQLEVVLQGSRGPFHSDGGTRRTTTSRGVDGEPDSPGQRGRPAGGDRDSRQRTGSSGGHGLTAARVERWGQAMARHPRWLQLKLGPPAGLRQLLELLQRQSWNPALTLTDDLDRRSAGLGSELASALRGPASRTRLAVRAAFALYGPSALEWLEDDPLRVVSELLRRIELLERQQQGPRRRGTRTANHSAGADGSSTAGRDRTTGQEASRRAGAREGRQQQHGHTNGPRSGGDREDHRREQRQEQGQQTGAAAADGCEQPLDRPAALRLLELQEGASLTEIRRAYRRLAKIHHPDAGGDGAAFRRLDAAYRLLR